MLKARVIAGECHDYEVVESKVDESKFVVFMLHSRLASSFSGGGPYELLTRTEQKSTV